ncbi:MAG TPA: citrate synthase/methylcitrate synthase [Bryobacteraceae bacterium]|jgi:citrate synthase
MADTATRGGGLEGLVAADTALSEVDGEAGRLTLCGYALEDLAPRAEFEETVYLFLNGRLPNRAELAGLRRELAARRTLPTGAQALLRDAARNSVPVMDALRMAAPTLSIGRNESAAQEALTAIAAFPTIVGSYWRLKQGLDTMTPRPDLGHAAHYLHQLYGGEPAPERTRAVETYLNTVCDHGFNASTFTARVIISTRSDVISAVTGAVGALKGPLHGGAPGPALDMVFEIGTPERAEPYIREKLARGERLMGFGHRIYRTRDPRADVLAAASEHVYHDPSSHEFYEFARKVEQTALRLLEELKPGRRLQTNVEFYTALLLHGAGLETELFTPTFAVGRVLGWTAHCMEQIKEDRLIRPQSRYVGPRGRKFVAIEERG